MYDGVRYILVLYNYTNATEGRMGITSAIFVYKVIFLNKKYIIAQRLRSYLLKSCF
jgi:hypothetical protein